MVIMMVDSYMFLVNMGLRLHQFVEQITCFCLMLIILINVG